VPVLAVIALVPSAPVLVPELAGVAAAEVASIREAVMTAAGRLPDRWVAIGVGSTDQTFGPETRGTFAGYGVDVPVLLSPDAAGAAVAAVPLAVLFAGWVRGQVNPHARVDVRVYPADLDVGAAAQHGRVLRAEIDAIPDQIGVLVVADGANTLSPSAPGGYDPGAPAVQDALDNALATPEPATLLRLSDGVVGRVAFQVLAVLVEGESVLATELARSAPYGVGYFVGVWRRS
jgi:hypothetical protein